MVIDLYPHEDPYPQVDYRHFIVKNNKLNINVRFTGAIGVYFNEEGEYYYTGAKGGDHYTVKKYKLLGKISDPLKSNLAIGEKIYIDERVSIPHANNGFIAIGEFMTKKEKVEQKQKKDREKI